MGNADSDTVLVEVSSGRSAQEGSTASPGSAVVSGLQQRFRAVLTLLGLLVCSLLSPHGSSGSRAGSSSADRRKSSAGSPPSQQGRRGSSPPSPSRLCRSALAYRQALLLSGCFSRQHDPSSSCSSSSTDLQLEERGRFYALKVGTRKILINRPTLWNLLRQLTFRMTNMRIPPGRMIHLLRRLQVRTC